MLYFGCGYPGLDFPEGVVVIPPAFDFGTTLELEIPMRVHRGRVTRHAVIERTATYAMPLGATLELPTLAGVPSQIEFPMRVTRRPVVEVI